MNTHKKSALSNTELRIIGVSLAILSLGLAIAWAGFIYFSQEKNERKGYENPTLQQSK